MTSTDNAVRMRWPYVAGQGRLGLGAVLLLVGAFLPWIDTIAGNFFGFQAGGMWTFAAGGVGLAGAVWKRQAIVLIHAAIAGVVGFAIPAWTVLDLVATGGMFQVWVPSIGVIVTLFGGGLALSGALTMWQRRG